jgi:hypothetical protein
LVLRLLLHDPEPPSFTQTREPSVKMVVSP